MELDIRWKQRLDNFNKACILLSEIHDYNRDNTIPIIKEGFVQRFEITFELSWKTLRDYLVYLGHEVQPSPRPVIKEAFAVEIIKDGQVFIDMLDSRNVLSHKYDEETFNTLYQQIYEKYEPALQSLRKFLMEKSV